LEGACYNFQEIKEDNIVEKLHWKKVFEKSVSDKEWINFLEGRGFRSGIAHPISLFYRDLLRIFPRAKFVILPPETAHSNGSVQINPSFNLYEGDNLGLRKDGNITNNLQYISSNGKAGCTLTKSLVRTDDVNKRIDESINKDSYDQWFEDMKKSIPEDKFLILNLKDEWDSLCSFLEIPIPDIPFPKNDDVTFKNIGESLQQPVELNNNESKVARKENKPNRLRNLTVPLLLLICFAYGMNRKQRNWYCLGGMVPCQKCVLFSLKNMFTTFANNALHYILHKNYF